ncbi:PREDICTED: mediator of RNA polymerase II transcription subunit 20a-like isoform X2 [Tarenaya hassleriana]|uniref:mediator of RNA polymerase II transcription subunit 20a-like isoform X2 n=1 Tax=Tarenaya hassleriana TaxID=28532 RepID=UPI00053C3A06|nr:PREDICTED: mediator of RNA polymerase II transcription subunit 20a-like isoform X2 [Tarenaya hassleriana]
MGFALATQSRVDCEHPDPQRGYAVPREHQWRQRRKMESHSQLLQAHHQAAAYELPRDFLGISLAEQPSKYYFIISTQRIILEADASIQMIMEKLQSYKSRVTLYFEGSQYQLGDFRLRVGKVVPINSENLRGIVMEVALLLLCLLRSFYYVSMVFMVEYLPLSSMEKAKQVMYEFLEICQEALSKRSLPGYFMHIAPNFGEFGLSDNYSPQHTAVQYAFIVAHLIASVQAMRN